MYHEQGHLSDNKKQRKRLQRDKEEGTKPTKIRHLKYISNTQKKATLKTQKKPIQNIVQELEFDNI